MSTTLPHRSSRSSSGGKHLRMEAALSSRKALTNLNSNNVNVHASKSSGANVAKTVVVLPTTTPNVPRPTPFFRSTAFETNNDNDNDRDHHHHHVVPTNTPRNNITVTQTKHPSSSTHKLHPFLAFTPIAPKRTKYPFTPIPIGTNQTLNGDLEDLMKFLDDMSFGPSPSSRSHVGKGSSDQKASTTKTKTTTVKTPKNITTTTTINNSNNNHTTLTPATTSDHDYHHHRHDSMVVHVPSEFSLLRDHREVNVELFHDDWEPPVWDDSRVVDVVPNGDSDHEEGGANHHHINNNNNEEGPLWEDSLDVMVPSQITSLRDAEETEAEITAPDFAEEEDDDAEVAKEEEEEVEDGTMLDNSMAVQVVPDASSIRDDLGDDTLEISKQETFDMLHSQSQHVLEDAKHELEWSQQWAEQMKQAVLAWVQQQRALIEHERQEHHRLLEVSNATINVSSLGHDGIELTRKDDNELRDQLGKLQQELKAATERHEQEKVQLQGIIQQQHVKIQDLEQQLAANHKGVSSSSRMSASVDSVSVKMTNTTQASKHKASTTTIAVKSPLADDTKERPPPCTSIRVPKSKSRTRESPSPSGRTQHEQLRDGCHVVKYRNGTRKETHPDGTCIIRFPNGDIQTTSVITGAYAYYHASVRTIQVRHKDGSQIFEFPNQQVERHFPDGRVMVLYPDGTKKKKYPDGTIETTFADGVHVLLERPDGKREVRTLDQTKA